MEIKISGHNFEYDAIGMSLLFFPGESVVFVKKATGSTWLSSRLVENKNGLFAKATFKNGSIRKECCKKVFGSDNESLLAAVKYTIYQVFHRATGISPPWGILTGIKPTGVYRRILDDKGPAETRRFLIKEYCMQPEKIPLLHQICKVMETVKTDPRREASIYVSIPFCPSRCSYCSFISVSGEKSNHLIERYLVLLKEEIREKCEILRRNNLSVRSVYVGGGTPGILSCEQIQALISVINENVGALEEFTFEIGRPDMISLEKLELLKKMGVSRLCINTQTTNDCVLEQIGRRHTGAQYLDAMKLVRPIGFQSINTDLIVGLPGDSFESFVSSLDDVIAAGADNITIHTLSIKRSSRLHHAGNYFDPSNDLVRRMLDYAYGRLLNEGFIPYYMYRQKNTVSNGENIGFSKPETIGRYNLYMMEDLHSVAACGAGASSKLIGAAGGRIERVINMKYPYEYINENDKIQKNTALFEEKLKELS